MPTQYHITNASKGTNNETNKHLKFLKVQSNFGKAHAMFLACKVPVISPSTQCADGESNKIVWDKKETVIA